MELIRAWARGWSMLVLTMAMILVPAGAGLAKQPPASFKAINWVVYTGGQIALPPTPTSTRHVVAPNGTLTLCNMGQFSSLTINFSFKNTPGRVFDKHGHLLVSYKFVFAGPEGSQTSGYATFHRSGRDALVWAFVGDFPGHKSASVPIPAGKYMFRFKRGSQTLMRTSITFKSTNTC